MIDQLRFDKSENNVKFGENVTIEGIIDGSRNTVFVGRSSRKSHIRLSIKGNDNVVHIEGGSIINGLRIVIGSHVGAHKCQINIGSNFSIEPNGFFEVLNDLSNVHIGKSCMFSRDIKIHCGDKPHLIFDKGTGSYRDTSDGIRIDDHVWVGERVYMTKKAGVPEGSIVAACAVVTRRFTEANIAVGGNPAKIISKGVRWIRNRTLLPEGSIYEKSIAEYDAFVNAAAAPKLLED
jgi:acetyltransferase-like isoleucine patch superfamily enzyme